MLDDQALDPAQLRSFLAVADTLHFTAAARRRGVSQSTISQHLTRLERALGRPLLQRSTKAAELTADGAAMVQLARDILAAHDRALGYFDSATLRGRLRFGVSEDLVLSRLPDILRAFRASHPLVELELEVGLSAQLSASLAAGQLDLVFAKRLAGDGRGHMMWRERLQWLGSRDWRVAAGESVPLVLFDGASITRKAAIDAMGGYRRPWHVAVGGASLSALTAAVRAGFGITAQSSLLASTELVVVPAEQELPPLPEIEFIVLSRHDPAVGPARALLDAIRARADLLRGAPDAPSLPGIGTDPP